MEQINLTFILNGMPMDIQTKRSEYMKDIFKKYSIKIEKNIQDLYFLYNGIKLNEELRLKDINNNDKKIVILVHDNSNNKTTNEIINFQNIICPNCGENSSIDINDYKINLSKCKNGHNIQNILINELPDKFRIYETQVYCDSCNKNKNEVFNKEFYKCFACKVNLCPLCHQKHNKKHNIIKYELINYTCIEHGEKYLLYCKNCDKNLCGLCGLNHERNHDIINLKEILDENIEENCHKLRIKIDNLKLQINDIVDRLNKITNNLEIFYQLNEITLKNYQNKNNNYQILQNINAINKCNLKMIKDINQIVDEENVINKFNYLNEIYEKMTNKTNNYIDEQDNNNINININRNIKDIKLDIDNTLDIIKDKFQDKSQNIKNDIQDKKDIEDKNEIIKDSVQDENDFTKNNDIENDKQKNKNEEINSDLANNNDNNIIIKNNNNKDNNKNTEIIIEYITNYGKEVKLFGSDFVENNKEVCSIMFDNKELQLTEILKLNENRKKSIEIRLIGVDKINDISFMFHKCSSIISIKGISNIDTSKFTTMKSLFS